MRMPRSFTTAACLAAAAMLISAVDRPAATQEATPAEPPPTVARAIGLLQTGDVTGAAQMLLQITEEQPENARAWSVLGFTLRQTGNTEGALEAYQHALEFDQTAPQAMYNIGMIHAGAGETDEAFEWLLEARATNRVDLTQIGLDPAAQTLRGDARYLTLLPDEAEFADPFVEPAEIIHEWRGESAGDQFGWVARNIGDVDEDGIADFVTSAPTRTIGEGPNAGKVYVYSGGSGDLLWTADGKPAEQLGLGIDAAGDVNGDGVPDAIAGAPGGDRAYVYSGKDGSVVLEVSAREEGEFFGREVMDLGDVNVDGHDDVIVGAPRNDAAGEDAGRAYVISGADGSTLLELTGERAGDNFGSAAGGWVGEDGRVIIVIGAPNAGPNSGGRTYVWVGDVLTDEPSFVIEAGETGAQLGGMFLSVVGDVDADGHPDIYASDWANNAKGNSTGRIVVHSGASGELLLELTGESPGDGFGIGPADAGDVNGDGHADLVIGAWQQANAAASGGKVYVFSGKDGALLREYTGKVMGETFGFDATGMGDVNGDGVIDYLLTSAWSAVNGPRSGRVYIVSGK